MSSEFLQTNLWDRITDLAKDANQRYVAVAYLGTGAVKLLPLGQGDILVTDLRVQTVRAGHVNPFEIAEYLRRGVEVYSYANLHAKVFVFDNRATIASSNISNRSKNYLVECGVLVTDAHMVKSARGFVVSLTGAPVTPAYIRALKKEYKPPRMPPGEPRDGGNPHPRLWIERVDPVEFEDKENRLTKTGKVAARKKVKNKSRYSVEVVRYGTRSGLGERASFGDLVIHVWEQDDSLVVYPPSRIVHLKPYVNSKGAQRKLVFMEEPRNPTCLAWKEFKASLKKLGIARISEHTGREVSNPDQKHAVLGLWMSRHEQ